ncbi:MAG: folate family ECF transporter S component [Ruminococcaceae bacterium]|nr:folate family ECF transporter S component [Oscillospiraceae bacterium]
MQRSQKRVMTTRTLVYSALLAALSVVLARIFGMMPDESSRFSIEAVPIFLAGMLCGPLAGALVGFTADFVGCLFTPFGYNPIFCLPPILYGLCGGLLRHFLSKGVNLPRLAVSFLPPVLFGSVLYQSAALAAVYFKDNFIEGLILKLTTRSVQFAVVYALDVLIIYLLFRSNIFTRLGIWPPVKKERNTNPNER